MDRRPRHLDSVLLLVVAGQFIETDLVEEIVGAVDQ